MFHFSGTLLVEDPSPDSDYWDDKTFAFTSQRHNLDAAISECLAHFRHDELLGGLLHTVCIHSATEVIETPVNAERLRDHFQRLTTKAAAA